MMRYSHAALESQCAVQSVSIPNYRPYAEDLDALAMRVRHGDLVSREEILFSIDRRYHQVQYRMVAGVYLLDRHIICFRCDHRSYGTAPQGPYRHRSPF